MAYITNRNEIDQNIQRFIDAIKVEFGITSIYVFGSYIKGNFTDSSDIDIAVVGDRFTGDSFEDTLTLMRKRRYIDKRIEPHPFKVEDFDITNPYVKEIIDTGVKLM